MRRYGDNTLLYVRYNDENQPDADVERLRPGLLLGHVDRFITARDGTVGPPVTQTRARLCRNAYRLWRQQPDLSLFPLR